VKCGITVLHPGSPEQSRRYFERHAPKRCKAREREGER
jgi:hypothetical protein